ncbi:MAG: serine/threonine protein kinase [Myxococcales bacterium]|nr:serine/threonine protein kinase [Myxococcales bacterium]
MRVGSGSTRPQLVGDYLLERLLGVGGMAEVFVARRQGPHGFQKRVAIKRILPQLAHDPRLVAMFCDEARIQASLSHPGLVEVFDFGEHAGLPFIALEYVDGLSAAELIARIAARRRTVELAPALYIIREVLDALAYVHRATDEDGRPLGIVHRDVAPSNVLLGRQGQVKLGDFGILHSTAIDSRTVPGEMKGKVGYVSPEQALGMPLDGRSDLFSASIVLAELLICTSLFGGETEIDVLQSLHGGDLSRLRAGAANIPIEVREILAKGLSRWPEQRYQSAEEMAAAVDATARRLGLSLGAHVLSEWLLDLGLVALSSDVQQKPAPIARRRPLSDDQFFETVKLAPGESERPPPSILAALAKLVPENDARPPDELAHAVSVPSPGPRSEPEVSYRIQRAGGAVMGPFRLADVLEMLATGRLSIDSAASRNGGAFLAVPSLTELSRMQSRPAYRFHEPIALYTQERWAVRLEHTPGLLFDIARRRRTGMLCARRGAAQVRLWFVDGEPVFASSTDPRELLGARLVADDGASQPAVNEAVEHAWRRGRMLGEVLIERGLATEDRVAAALREQTWSRLVALFRFRVGELAFVDGARHGDAVLALPPRLAFVASALLSAYRPDEVASVLETVERVGGVSAAPHAEAIQKGLELPAPEAEALYLARRGRALRGLMQEGVRSGAFDVHAARRAVLVGLASGALRWQD